MFVPAQLTVWSCWVYCMCQYVLCECVLSVCALTGQLRRSPMLLALRSSSPNMSGVGFSLHSSILTAWLLQHRTHTYQQNYTLMWMCMLGRMKQKLLWMEVNICCWAHMWFVATRKTLSPFFRLVKFVCFVTIVSFPVVFQAENLLKVFELYSVLFNRSICI